MWEVLLLALGCAAQDPAPAAPSMAEPAPLLTVAEASQYTRTSSHEEVLAFLAELKARSAHVRLLEAGRTLEGRSIVACAVGAAAHVDAVHAQRLDLPVVYVQANIHAGEVDGKEAVLSLLRDLLFYDASPGLLDELILLVVPNYNPDGNDRFGPIAKQRPGQVGPEQVGTRANSAGLDLNRDYVKAESEELSAVLRSIWNPWDPDVFVDMHTTNGSHHGFVLTYAPSLQPAPGAHFVTTEHFVRERLLPGVRRAMQEQHGFACFDYGNFDRRAEPRTWSTYDHRPRFGTNYAALRGRMGVLSESYSYADYRTRIAASRAFLLELLRAVARHGREIRQLHREQDQRVMRWGAEPEQAPALGIEFEIARRGNDEVLMAGTMRMDESGRARPSGELEPTAVAIYDRFTAVRSVPYPAGFFVPASEVRLIAALERHGILYQQVAFAWHGALERFHPTSIKIGARAFQGRQLMESKGDRRLEQMEVPAGWLWIPTAQPLGLLASYLLDPEYDDSLLTWREAEFEPAIAAPFPCYRALTPPLGLRTR